MEFQREFIEIGQVQIRYYGIIIVFAMLVATAVAAALAKRSGRDPEHVYGGLTWAIIPGIILARLWFILFPPEGLCGPNEAVCRDTQWFFENFFNTDNGAIAIWSGGLSIFGAVLGGLIGLWLYFGPLHNPVAKFFNLIFLPVTFVFDLIGKGINAALGAVGVKVSNQPPPPPQFPDRGMRLLPWLDIGAVVLPLGQAIGRWANFINQELYGTPTDLPWGIEIPRESLTEQYRAIEYFDARFHPIFLYESLWSLIAFGVLLYLFTNYRSRFRPGDFFLIYVIQYSAIRFLLEFLRVEVTLIELGGSEVNLSQLVTGVAFVLALAVLLYRHRPGVEVPPYDEAAPPEPLPTTTSSNEQMTASAT